MSNALVLVGNVCFVLLLPLRVFRLGGDQGLLNTYFNDWFSKDVRYRLSFVYNMSSNALYSYAAAYKRSAKRSEAKRNIAEMSVF